MSKPPQPVRSRAPSLPLVWVVPLVALAVGGWMVLREIRQRGPEVAIEFADGSGVEAGRTVLEYKGVSVGKVTGVQLKPDLSGVVVQLRLAKEAQALAKGGGRFWVVRPEVGFSGVRGLDTLITGARINVRPGDGAIATHFVGLDHPPPPEESADGRTFVLHGDKLGSLSSGAPVFYREVKVGVVESTRLANDAASVLVRIHIEGPYIDLVRTNSRFWNAGGFSFKVNLFGAQLKDTSLESLLTGGISFATPDQQPLAAVAPENATFALTTEPEKEWEKWRPQIPIRSPASTDPTPATLPALIGR